MSTISRTMSTKNLHIYIFFCILGTSVRTRSLVKSRYASSLDEASPLWMVNSAANGKPVYLRSLAVETILPERTHFTRSQGVPP